ncbi:MAG: dihydroneopterin triphosphate diphosphatase [Arenicellales bacterium]|nr:dihydroneopterin triphosphate diphosphatase [Arenicellales bacterium]
MIGQASFPAPDYKRPESVLVVVYTSDRETLILQRVGNSFWQSVTGSLNWGEESPDEAARRELFEETGIATEVGWRKWGGSRRFQILPEYRYRYGPGVVENEEHVFSVELPDRCRVQINSSEHLESRWVKIELAAQSIWSWTNRLALKQLAEEMA